MRSKADLLPCPRSFSLGSGYFVLPEKSTLQFNPELAGIAAHAIPARLRKSASRIGVTLATGSHRRASIAFARNSNSPARGEGYRIAISSEGVRIDYRETPGLHASVATLNQLFRQYGKRLPHLEIIDYPDFPNRGVMLDISRGRVPKIQTLLELAESIADFKINQLQLYTEHTFAYRKYRPVWRNWGAITAAEIRRLDARCQELGIQLVPNQNSFGHLRHWLQYPPLAHLAEVDAPYEGPNGAFLRYPSTLAPNHPGTLPFLRGLYDELLPNFSSRLFNIGCDETWDLGRGQSRNLCEKNGQGRVYLDFLKKICRETAARGRTAMFWGDIILKHPELTSELPENCVALNWGYEAHHPFDRETRLFAQSNIPFYVCPGTSTWMSLIGRHDNAIANLKQAARAGLKNGASGYLITDWGDGGHPQPLATSWFPYLAGAWLAWDGSNFNEGSVIRVLSRDVFEDASGRSGDAAFRLGLAHLKLGFSQPNLTPLGAVIAAPKQGSRELFCHSGLNYFSKIPASRVLAARAEIEIQRKRLLRASRATGSSPRVLAGELDLAARMATQSCDYMLWQQHFQSGRVADARRLARHGIRALHELDREFNAYWPSRNKGTPRNCSAFLEWRSEEYRDGAHGAAGGL